MGYFYHEDKKHYCGTYKGIDVWQCGQMIGSNWYGDFYVTVPRGKSKRDMMVKDSICRSIKGVKSYIDNNIDVLNQLKQ